ncbi:MAG: multiheme c-type cytochrome, partial [Proteobacteria bacterium]|nr:multiheme c-type cytochrome [Pseudomonadota bacterium]
MSFKLCNIVASAAFAFAFAQVAMSREAEGFRAPYYVSSQACATCHADATAKWSDSHHAWAWRAPSTQSVIGDFGDTSFTHNGVTTRFTRDGDKFLVETDGPDGQSTTYRIMGTVGVAALQQYIVETEPGRLQALDTVWDTERRRWFHLYPAQDLKAGDGLHWTGPYKNWNARCAECHATGFEKNYDPRTRTYLSRQAEIGVGCEACHGPGEAHLAWSDDPANFKSSDWQGINQFGFSANFSDDYPKAEIQQCATCHARR